MKTNPNEPVNVNEQSAWLDEKNNSRSGTGLTKRELFALMAFQGMISSSTYNSARNAALAVEYADALIAELNANKKD